MGPQNWCVFFICEKKEHDIYRVRKKKKKKVDSVTFLMSRLFKRSSGAIKRRKKNFFKIFFSCVVLLRQALFIFPLFFSSILLILDILTFQHMRISFDLHSISRLTKCLIKAFWRIKNSLFFAGNNRWIVNHILPEYDDVRKECNGLSSFFIQYIYNRPWP